MANFRLLDPGRKFTDSNGDPASGYQLFVYDAGTTTKATSYKDAAGASSHTNPIVLESDGGLPDRELWVPSGSYKLVLASDTDTDPPSSGTTIGDDLDPINDVAANSASEWTASGLTPTYVDGDTFTLVGDQTTVFHAGRRLQITDGGGTVYATISSSSYSDPDTTVNLTVDGGDTVDSSISAVSYGLLSAAAKNPSLEQAVHKIAEGSISAAATFEITDLSSDYFMYELVFDNLQPATDAVTLLLRTSTDNGSSYDSGASDYAYMGFSGALANTYAGANDQAHTSIFIGPANLWGSASNEHVSGSIRIYNPSAANYTHIKYDLAMAFSTGSQYNSGGMGARLSAADVDAIQILFSSGNIASMNYTLYGYLA